MGAREGVWANFATAKFERKIGPARAKEGFN